MITVELKNIRLFGHHGLYPEERKAGNEFDINLSVGYASTADTVTELADTINYVRLYEIVKAGMQEPVDLLETLAMQIAEKIKQEYPQVNSIDLSISKLHPPVMQFVGNVAVRFQMTY